ncbi:hypothetical protein BASA61_008376 [Batrachochytrium salamandrivorans]|nr:hypothetical protein BASA61_008376 [Batrachochytrium salamandrivorans]KAH9265235.1 hypothetical protein BASA83_011235 [Batrachochytrium salamandrivorans]KAJ1340885.1 hypothetical protein BSLG_004362 [Batrachochytrium salamandrivorans]
MKFSTVAVISALVVASSAIPPTNIDGIKVHGVNLGVDQHTLSSTTQSHPRIEKRPEGLLKYSGIYGGLPDGPKLALYDLTIKRTRLEDTLKEITVSLLKIPKGGKWNPFSKSSRKTSLKLEDDPLLALMKEAEYLYSQVKHSLEEFGTLIKEYLDMSEEVTETLESRFAIATDLNDLETAMTSARKRVAEYVRTK